MVDSTGARMVDVSGLIHVVREAHGRESTADSCESNEPESSHRMILRSVRGAMSNPGRQVHHHEPFRTGGRAMGASDLAFYETCQVASPARRAVARTLTESALQRDAGRTMLTPSTMSCRLKGNSASSRTVFCCIGDL